MRWLLCALCLVLPVSVQAAQREVGSGQTYTTIQACHTAAVAGDICNIHAGAYSGTVTVSKSMTFQNNAGDSPVLTGLFSVGSTANVTITCSNGGGVMAITGFGTSSLVAAGVTQTNGTGLTVTGCNIHDGFGPSVMSRNSTKLLVQGVTGNLLHDDTSGNDGSGIIILSGHSTDGTYPNGIRLLYNTFTNNDTDGMQINGQYFTIDGNNVLDNIHTDYLSQHPDGIQLNAGTADGFTSVQHARIINNVFRNHTQNIFTEGSTSGAKDCDDIWIVNNVVYNTSGLTNGLNVAAIGGVGLMIKWSKNVHIFGNYIGLHGDGAGNQGLGIHYQGSGAGTIEQKNNIISNPGGTGVWDEQVGTPSATGVDYNLYYNNVAAYQRVSTIWTTLSQIQSGSTYEDHGIAANPLTNTLPTPTLQSGSPAIDAGINLFATCPLCGTDKNGILRGAAWDVGPYEYGGVLTPPSNLHFRRRLVP